MKIGFIGLGKMGSGMVSRLADGGHEIIGYDVAPEISTNMSNFVWVTFVSTIDELIEKLTSPRIIWMMVPAGKAMEEVFQNLVASCQPGDLLIDGGNSNYKDTISRAESAHERGIGFVDVGISGGIWGQANGYSIMAGGDERDFERIKPLIITLAPDPDHGWGHVGKPGAGHFAKMIHNGVEYGLMEAYAEGFELLKSKTEFNYDLQQISQIWQNGSVVRSWLLELIDKVMQDDGGLEGVKGWVDDSGEGRWTVNEAVDLGIPAPVISSALYRRFESRQKDSYASKLLAALRNQFGGHAIKK